MQLSFLRPAARNTAKKRNSLRSLTANEKVCDQGYGVCNWGFGFCNIEDPWPTGLQLILGRAVGGLSSKVWVSPVCLMFFLCGRAHLSSSILIFHVAKDLVEVQVQKQSC